MALPVPGACAAPKPVQLRHRDIVRVRAAERHAVAPKVRGILPARIGRLGVLDLDDACAEASQQERGKRPRERQREIEHGKACQRALGRRVVAGHLAVEV